MHRYTPPRGLVSAWSWSISPKWAFPGLAAGCGGCMPRHFWPYAGGGEGRHRKIQPADIIYSHDKRHTITKGTQQNHKMQTKECTTTCHQKTATQAHPRTHSHTQAGEHSFTLHSTTHTPFVISFSGGQRRFNIVISNLADMGWHQR